MPDADVLRTGIAGLDDILLGGLPRGNVVIVTGSPGTGKTTLGVEFVYRGAHDFAEPGIIVTFEVSAESSSGTPRSLAGTSAPWKRKVV